MTTHKITTFPDPVLDLQIKKIVDAVNNITANQILPSQTGNNGKFLTTDGSNSSWGTPSFTGAPSTAKYIVQTADAGLSAEQALGDLATGIVKNTTSTGVLSIAIEGTDFPYIPRYARVTGSNVTTTGQTLEDITGLSISLEANTTYEFEAVLSCLTSADTTGTSYGVNYSAAGAAVEGQISGSFTATAAKVLRISALNTAYGAFLTTSAQSGGVILKGIVTTAAQTGNFTVKHLKVASGTSTVYIGSYLKVVKIA